MVKATMNGCKFKNSRSQSDVPGEEGEEIISPKRKIIRVETQDHVREATDTDQLSNWQLASVVIQEGEESYTTNLCQKCYNDSLRAKGKNTYQLAVETVRGAKGAPWKALENDGKCVNT